jgi:hypothetical protein
MWTILLSTTKTLTWVAMGNIRGTAKSKKRLHAEKSERNIRLEE